MFWIDELVAAGVLYDLEALDVIPIELLEDFSLCNDSDSRTQQEEDGDTSHDTRP